MNAHTPQAGTSAAAIIRFHEAMAEAHRALADLARAKTDEVEAHEPVLPVPLVRTVRMPETVSVGEGREERAVDDAPTPHHDAPILEPAPAETAPDPEPETKEAPLVFKATRETPPPPPPMPKAKPKEFPTKAAHIEHLWRNTALTTSEIARITGSSPSGVRGLLSKRQLTMRDRPSTAPPSPPPGRPIGFTPAPHPTPKPLAGPMVPRRDPPPAAKEKALLFPAETVLIIHDDGEVIGPGGVLKGVAAPTRRVLARLAAIGRDQMLDDAVLLAAGPFPGVDNLHAHLNHMRHRLAEIGVELFQPLKGFWKVRRA